MVSRSLVTVRLLPETCRGMYSVCDALGGERREAVRVPPRWALTTRSCLLKKALHTKPGGGQTEMPSAALDTQPSSRTAQCWGKKHSRPCTQPGQEGQGNAQGAGKAPVPQQDDPSPGNYF